MSKKSKEIIKEETEGLKNAFDQALKGYKESPDETTVVFLATSPDKENDVENMYRSDVAVIGSGEEIVKLIINVSEKDDAVEELIMEAARNIASRKLLKSIIGEQVGEAFNDLVKEKIKNKDLEVKPMAKGGTTD